MRGLTVLAAAALATVPMSASAQDAEPANIDTTELTDKLTDPEFQAQMSDAMRAMSGVLMDIPVGPLMEAAEKMSREMGGEKGDRAVPDVDPDATVRDLAGDKAEQATEDMAERLPQMMDTMAGMTDAMAAMLPALEAMAKQMQGAVKPAR